MNWGALIQIVLSVFEKNPDLAGNLIQALLSLFANNPTILAKAVTVGIAHAEAALPQKSV